MERAAERASAAAGNERPLRGTAPEELCAMTEDQATAPPASAPEVSAARPGLGSRIGAVVIAILIVASLVLYFVGDRVVPYTSQARIQAFVIPVAGEVSGKVEKVHVRNNDEVQAGQP